MAAAPKVLLYVLAGYFVLQIVLNLGVRAAAQRSANRALTALKGSFWASMVNALYFIVAAILLHVYNVAPNRGLGPYTLWWALGGVPLGVGLWYLSAKARGLGIRFFGTSNLVAGEDAILRFPPAPQYLTWGVANQALVQPLGRELFLRGAFLPIAIDHFGWGWAVAATVLVELVPRLNVVWLPWTLLYSLSMCLLFYLSGGALCGLITASVCGLIHSVVIAYIAAREDHQAKEVSLEHSVRSLPRRMRQIDEQDTDLPAG
jgi:hypothetical protein